MSASEQEELEFLARARRDLSPSAGDAARVLAAVESAVSMPLAADAPSAPATGVSATTGAVSGKLAVWLVASATALGAGGAGYYFGYRAGRSDAASERVAMAQKVIAPREPLAVTPVPVPVPAPEAAVAPEPKIAQRAPATRASVQAVPSPAPAALVDPELEEETRLVVRVERALRDDNPRFALGLLGELDRKVAVGQLVEEREAARVMAHCQLGSEFASRLAADFAARRPQSAYLARIGQVCEKAAPEPTDSSKSGNSSFKEGRFP